MDELADFVLSYYREAGAIVEPPAYGVYEVLLPDTVAARLDAPAYQRLAFGDALTTEADRTDEVTRLSYGHPLVESLIEAARRSYSPHRPDTRGGHLQPVSRGHYRRLYS